MLVDSEMPSGTGATATATSLTYAWTNTAGTFLLVGVVLGSPGITISGVTYGGVAMTLVKNQIGHDGVSGALVALYKLISPPTGANNVVINVSSSTVIISGAISFTGQNSTPLGTPVGNFGGSGTITISVTGTTVGSIIVDVATAGGAIPSDSQTPSWVRNVDGGSFGNNARSSRAAGTGGTVTLAHGDPSDGWGNVAVEVIAASGGGAASLLTSPTRAYQHLLVR